MRAHRNAALLRLIAVSHLCLILFLSSGCYITLVERRFTEEDAKTYAEKIKTIHVNNIRYHHGNEQYSQLGDMETLMKEELAKAGYKVADSSQSDSAELCATFWFTETQYSEYEVQVRVPVGEIADASGTRTHTIYEYQTETRTRVDKWAHYSMVLDLYCEGKSIFFLKMEAVAQGSGYDREKADLIHASIRYLPEPYKPPEPAAGA